MNEITHILPCVQNYAWGKPGSTSEVALLAQANAQLGLKVDGAKPYAELWMGTHPNGPARTVDGTDLKALLVAKSEIPEALEARFGKDLPFLLKVLSIQTALSIQAHPDKPLAERLHAQFPDVYKDPNHKPEMAIALTPFEGLCGFRPLAEIQANLAAFPELAALVEPATLAAIQGLAPGAELPSALLAALFKDLMTSPETVFGPKLTALVARLTSGGATYRKGEPAELVVRLHEQYGIDIGVFNCLVLNYIFLQPGEGMYLAANVPHAYLSGDCVECMATSDNVVRAGLTPKFKDVPTLLDMLIYKATNPQDNVLRGEAFGARTRLYNPPIPEFAILLTELPAGETETTKALGGPAVTIVTQGEGELNGVPVARGAVLYVPKDVALASRAGPGGLTFYTAFCAPEYL